MRVTSERTTWRDCDVDVVVAHRAALERHLELERLAARQRLTADELDRVPLLAPVDQGPFDVPLVDAGGRVGLGRHLLRLELSLERRHLPALLAVVREDALRALVGELESEAARALDLAHHLGDPSAARGRNAGLADRGERLELFLAAARGEIRIDDLVDRRRTGAGGEERAQEDGAGSRAFSSTSRVADHRLPLAGSWAGRLGVRAGVLGQ